MRDPQRIDNILERLKIVWKDNPDLRLGQLLLAVVKMDRLFYIEDEKLILLLEDYFMGDWMPMIYTKGSEEHED